MRDSQPTHETLDPASPMRHRWLRIVAPAAALALVSGGVAVASVGGDRDDNPGRATSAATSGAPSTTSTSFDDSSRNTSSSSNTSSTPAPGTPLADGTSTTYAAAGAGTVTVQRNGATLLVTGTTANPGWTVHIERGNGFDVEVEFINGAVKIHFEAEFEHGAVLVVVETRAISDGSSSDDDSGSGSGSSNSGSGSGSGSDDSGGSSGSGKGGSGRGGVDDSPNHT